MFDMAYSSLLDELAQRGLLEKTMVLGTGEFGRTPKVNPAGGRDHWPQCWTILMAGGGIKGGQVIGSSDEIGSAPKDRPTTPAQVAATVFRGLGIDLGTELPGGRGTGRFRWSIGAWSRSLECFDGLDVKSPIYNRRQVANLPYNLLRNGISCCAERWRFFLRAGNWNPVESTLQATHCRGDRRIIIRKTGPPR